MNEKGSKRKRTERLIQKDVDDFPLSLLQNCSLCARRCGVNRTQGELGVCRAGLLPRVACRLSHMGEEPPLSGEKGSGTIFFSYCSLRCIFCQNMAISQQGQGTEISLGGLSEMMLELQAQGCHNINLVSPTHYAPQISLALDSARDQGLHLPVVYNTHGYDTQEALQCLEGRVDVYLPDVKYANNQIGKELSGVPAYPEANRTTLRTMFSQVGHLRKHPKTHTATRGLLVRILILPRHLEGAKASLVFLKTHFSTALSISLMAQYTPLHKARERSSLNRTLDKKEYEDIVDFALSLGFENLWLQDPKAAYQGIPDFSSEVPFVF